MADRLFGTLQTPLKPNTYTGIDSTTISVVVDNTLRTIQAELDPQIVTAIRQNLSNISDIGNRLTQLKAEMQSLEQMLDTYYAGLNRDIKALETTSDRLQGEIDSVKELYATETDVKNWIDEARMPQADLLSYAKIEDVNGALSDIRNTMTQADTELSSNIETATTIANEGFTSATLAHNRISTIDETLEDLSSAMSTMESSITSIEEEIDSINVTVNTTLATKAELVALEEEVDSTYVNKTQLSDYATTEWVNSQTFVTEDSLESREYTSKQYVDELFDSIVAGEAEIELINYYTKWQTDDILKEYATKDYVDTSVSSVEDTLSDYATKSYVDNAVENVTVDLSSYATQAYVDDAISKIDFSDINLDDYYDKEETEELLENTLNSITLIEASID